MKHADCYEYEAKPNLKRLWVLLVVALPTTSILLINSPMGLRFWSNFGKELDSSYRYHFNRPSSGSITLALEQEISFYQERIWRNPEGGLDRASLARVYLKMARATGDANWYLLAEQAAQQSLAKLPFHNDDAVLALARVAEARHDFAEAIRLTEQVSGEDTLSIWVTSKLALGQVDEANQAANALVNHIPTLGSLTLRALVQVAQGKDREAIQDFQAALAAEEPGETGSSVWVRTLLGRFYYKRGQLEKADQLYREALRVLPQYAPALLNLAELEIRLGHYGAAERLYSQFFVLSQHAPTVYDHVVLRGMARVKDLKGDRAGAREWRDQAEARLRRDLTSFGHRRELARLLIERDRAGDVTEALNLMQAEVRVRRDAETFNTMALALSRQQRWHEAQQAMREALHWGVRDPGMFHQAGVIEQALGNQSQALTYFRLAQETDPSFDERAKAALGLGVGLGLN